MFQVFWLGGIWASWLQGVSSQKRKEWSRFTIDCVFLDCSCADLIVFRLRLPLRRRINGVILSSRSLILNQDNTVPLDQFVCELSERCPPGCRCVHRPANATLHIYCSNTNLTVLPLELPELPKSYTKYKLDFSNNRLLRRLEHRDYFVNTSILDVSNSDIQVTESADVWNSILNIPQVNLYGNKLTSISKINNFPKLYNRTTEYCWQSMELFVW